MKKAQRPLSSITSSKWIKNWYGDGSDGNFPDDVWGRQNIRNCGYWF